MIFLLLLQDFPLHADWAGKEMVLEKLPDLSKFAAVGIDLTGEGSFELRFTGADRVLWRKIDAPGKIVIPFWQFRRTGNSTRVGRWKDVKELRLVARAETARVENFRLVAGATSFVEPLEELKKRTGMRAKEGRARLLTNCADLDLEKLSGEVEKFWKLFCETFGEKEPEAISTLLIFERAGDYRKFTVDTARDVFAGVAGEPTAGGFTFERYSATSRDGHRMRPVYFHELLHQWVTDVLDIGSMSGWVHEGICYYLQNRFLPQPDLADEVKKYRPRPLAEFTGRYNPVDGRGYLQSMLPMQFLVEGPRERLPRLLDSFADGAGLLPAVEKILEKKPEEFEREWRAFSLYQFRIMMAHVNAVRFLWVSLLSFALVATIA